MYLERPNNLIEKVSAFTCPIMYIMYFLWEEFKRKIGDAHEVQNYEVKHPEKEGSREGNFFPWYTITSIHKEIHWKNFGKTYLKGLKQSS